MIEIRGMTAEQEARLRALVPQDSWSGRGPAAGAMLRVYAAAAREDIRRSGDDVHAILWIPKGQEPLPFDAWCDEFDEQLCEGDPADEERLRALLRTPGLTEWEERVADVPPPWFADLTRSPRELGLNDLPFSPGERATLERDAALRAAVIERLQQEAERYWSFSVPSPDEIGAWLESPAPDPVLERRLSRCALAREMARRQAGLWQGAGLIDAGRHQAKLDAAGLAAPPQAAFWQEAALAWDSVREKTAGAFAALLERAFKDSGLQSAGATRGTGASAEISSSGPLTLTGEDRWVYLRQEGDAILVRAGESAADLYNRFAVVFLRGGEEIVRAEASDGVARLTAEHLTAAEAGSADRLAIEVAGEEAGAR